MTLQTIEVEIDASGHVHALEPQVQIPTGPALLTPLGARLLTADAAATPGRPDDWHALVGVLRGSPNWRGDPQAIQDELRGEWR